MNASFDNNYDEDDDNERNPLIMGGVLLRGYRITSPNVPLPKVEESVVVPVLLLVHHVHYPAWDCLPVAMEAPSSSRTMDEVLLVVVLCTLLTQLGHIVFVPMRLGMECVLRNCIDE